MISELFIQVTSHQQGCNMINAPVCMMYHVIMRDLLFCCTYLHILYHRSCFIHEWFMLPKPLANPFRVQGYELGMFHFIAMEWQKAHEHLNCVYVSVNSDKASNVCGNLYKTTPAVQKAHVCRLLSFFMQVFFPYRTLVTTQFLWLRVFDRCLCAAHQPTKCFDCQGWLQWRLAWENKSMVNIFARRQLLQLLSVYQAKP